MTYAAPTLADLRVAVARDLRDATNDTFTLDQVLDYINEGIVEINRIRPVEDREEYEGDDALTDLPFNYVFMVEFCSQANAGDPLNWSTINPSEEEVGYGRNGWTYFGHTLHLAPQIVYSIDRAVTALTAAQVHLAIWGYVDRDLLTADTDDGEDVLAPFADGQEEFAVRKFARLAGFRALSLDRALFQQWQQQANNSDISETQLNAMVNTYETDWERLRKGLYTIRRPAVG